MIFGKINSYYFLQPVVKLGEFRGTVHVPPGVDGAGLGQPQPDILRYNWQPRLMYYPSWKKN